MAVTRREAQIIALYEAGMSSNAIARKLSLTDGTVKNVVVNLCHGLGEDTRHQRAMIAASARLAGAIREARAL